MTLEIKNLENPDILVEINHSGLPFVNPLDDSRAQWLIENSSLARMAILNGKVAGVLVVLSENPGLISEYLQWFCERYGNFLYIDRVIVSAWARDQGVAKRLYREVDQVAMEKSLAIATEVYSDPPNLVSLSFHQKMGFEEIGTQYCQTDKKWVSKLMKYIQYAQIKTVSL
jgi:predicted GNAT superfamily acetyltransferase